MKPTRLAYTFTLALIALLGVLHVQSFGFCFQDDTYIGLRYSRNLADGYGPVFNPGEPVEGYTNFLWIAVSTVPFLAGIDPITFTRILGILSALFAAASAGWLAFTLSGGSRKAFIIAFAFVISLPFAMAEAAMGLETLLFTGLVLGALASYYLENSDTVITTHTHTHTHARFYQDGYSDLQP